MAGASLLVLLLVLLALAAELLIGFVVLERGEERLAARFLGAFMLLHAVSFGVVTMWLSSMQLSSMQVTETTLALSIVLLNGLPALLLGFAFTYPSPHAWVQDRSWLLALLFLPFGALIALFVVDPRAILAGTGPGNVPFTVLGFLVGLLLVALVAAGAFLWRAHHASTSLERRRLGYMAKVIAVPTAVLGAVTAPTFAFIDLGDSADVVVIGLMSSLALVPAFGLGYGVLKYRVLDLDLKVKRGIKGSTVAAAFIAAFFVASEGAQVLFAGFAGNEIVGVLAAGALVFVLSPLQQLAAKVSDTAMPGVEDTREHREERKTEVYRATLEELLADGETSTKDRRVLLSLQESLGLDGNEANRLEREVLDELGEGPPEGASAAVEGSPG